MEGTFNVKELRRDFTGKPQSVRYSKPIDKGMVTEPEGEKPAWPFRKATKEDLPDFEVKSVVEKESCDMIYKSGYVECLNHLEKFMDETIPTDADNSVLQERMKFARWAHQQRTTLNKYL